MGRRATSDLIFLPPEWQLDDPAARERLSEFVHNVLENVVRNHARHQSASFMYYSDSTTAFLNDMLRAKMKDCLTFYDELKAQDIASKKDVRDIKRTLDTLAKISNHDANARLVDETARCLMTTHK